MCDKGQVFEGNLNVKLSELLEERGIVSRSEFSYSAGRKDVLVHCHGLDCVLEGSYSKADAEKDAKRRIEQLNSDIALAIQYDRKLFPQDLGEQEIKKRLSEATFPVKIIIPEDVSEDFLGTLFENLYERRIVARPAVDWHERDLDSLVTLLKEAGQFLMSEQALKDIEEEVKDFVSEFVDFLANHPDSKRITKNLYNVLYNLYEFSIGNPENIKEAIFAQSVLAVLLGSIYYESIRYGHGLKPLKILDSDPQQALFKATCEILKINYEQIFKIVEEILNYLPQSQRLFGKLIDLATKIASKKALLRKDLAGKIYHTIVGEWSLKKGLATYFTEIPSAYLLAYLGRPQLGKIGDFACGSGTLLVATYSAVNYWYRLSLHSNGIDQEPKEIEREFYQNFIKSCYGFDVLAYAAQITVLNLALLNPETVTNKFNINTLPLGARGSGEVSLGSLDLVRSSWSLWNGGAQVKKTGLEEVEKVSLYDLQDRELSSFSFIIMNPPFTRATGRGQREGGGLFGFIPDSAIRGIVVNEFEKFRDEVEEDLIQQTKSYLASREVGFLMSEDEFNSYRSIGQAGEGLLFLYLADKMIKDEGKICFVLPKNLLSGISWFLIRALLAQKYHIENIVVSYDSELGYNFSQSTNLSECLIVAKRTDIKSDSDETKFIILLKKPDTSMEAIALAKKVEENGEYIESNKARAFVVNVKRPEMESYLDNWGRFVFLPNPKILSQIKKLLEGIIEVGDSRRELTFTRLNNLIATIGIDAHQFSDNFKKVSGEVPGSKKCIYGGSEDIRITMGISPNAFVLPNNDGERLFQEKAGRLLIPDRIWIDTAHIISMLSNDRVLSNIFYALRLKDEDEAKLKALCLWLNTTWGILTILANKQETRGGWIRLKMGQWRLLPVLDVTKLSNQETENLAEIFEKFKSKDLGRIPQQYRPESNQLRKELDKDFLESIGVYAKKEDLDELYSQIDSSLRQWLGES